MATTCRHFCGYSRLYVRKNYLKCQHQQSVFITGRYRYFKVCTFLKRFLHLAVIVKRRGKVDLLITFFITSQKQISFGKKICSRTLPRQIFLLFCGRAITICILFPPHATCSHHCWMLIIIWSLSEREIFIFPPSYKAFVFCKSSHIESRHQYYTCSAAVQSIRLQI